MAHKHPAPVSDDGNANTPNKQRPTTIDLNRSSSNLPELNASRASLSPAEQYILEKAEMAYGLNNSAPFENASIAGSTTSVGFSQRQDQWRENECKKIYGKDSQRYKYGSPPPKTTSTNRRLGSQSDDDHQRSSNPLSAAFRLLRK